MFQEEMIGKMLTIDDQVVGIIARANDGTLYVESSQEKFKLKVECTDSSIGVRLLDERGQKEVAASLKELDDESLLKKLKSYKEMPTCLFLTKKELEARGFVKNVNWS